jgi:hypothetical protein
MSVGCKSICIPFSEHLLDWFHISIPPEMSTTKSPVAMIAITE